MNVSRLTSCVTMDYSSDFIKYSCAIFLLFGLAWFTSTLAITSAVLYDTMCFMASFSVFHVFQCYILWKYIFT